MPRSCFSSPCLETLIDSSRSVPLDLPVSAQPAFLAGACGLQTRHWRHVSPMTHGWPSMASLRAGCLCRTGAGRSGPRWQLRKKSIGCGEQRFFFSNNLLFKISREKELFAPKYVVYVRYSLLWHLYWYAKDNKGIKVHPYMCWLVERKHLNLLDCPRPSDPGYGLLTRRASLRSHLDVSDCFS